MIKFFRQIRYNLMEKGKTGKYFKYAIGEIVLVVIGILIALQINNWNESRNKNKKLETYLIALKQELNSNILHLQRASERSSSDFTRSISLIKVLNSDSAQYFTSNDIKDNNVGPIFKIDLFSSVFNDIINTGVLENMKDLELKKKIFEIQRHFDNYDEYFVNARRIWDDYMLPYHSKHINVIGLWDSINKVPTPKLPFKNDVEAFVYNREYANMLASRSRMLANLDELSIDVKDYFETLIIEINNYLQYD